MVNRDDSGNSTEVVKCLKHSWRIVVVIVRGLIRSATVAESCLFRRTDTVAIFAAIRERS